MKGKWTTLKGIIGEYDLSGNVCLTLMTEEGRIVCANANMIRTMHLRNPREQNISFFDFLHPTQFQHVKTAIRSTERNKENYGIELFLKNGQYHPMKWKFHYVGDVVKDAAWLCVGHSFSGAAPVPDPAKAASVQTEAVFHEFMKNAPNLYWVVDQEGHLVYANGLFLDYFALDAHNSFNKKVSDLLPARAANALYNRHLAVYETGEPDDFTEKVKWADGTTDVFRINLFPVKTGESKRLVGGMAVSLNDKYEAEKKLRQLNERLTLLTAASSDAIWEWDMQTGQIFRNEALMSVIGYSHETPKGLSWWLRRIHPEDRNRVSDKVKETTEQNLQSWQDEYRFKCADGQYKHMRDKGYVVYENELPVKMIGSIQDISGLKELEEQLLEEKLQRQKEISETVIKVQEQERTRIGHELHDNVNQILSTTKLFVDMIKPTLKEEKQYKEKSIEYLMMAIEEIRKLSKELVVPQLTQKGLVDSIYTMIEDMQVTTGIKFKFTHDHEIDLVSPGKRVSLFRIIQEQLKNIINHSKAKEVDILLQRKDNETQLTIRDNGIGFESGHTHRGIGLSNIYERTRFYNGTADIESAPGKGCILRVSIPGL